MRKEIIVVTITGIFLGILVAFGVWRANNALRVNSSDNSQGLFSAKLSPSPTPNNGFSLTIAKPEENDVLVEEKTVISGITKPSTLVTISTETEDYVVAADSQGVFELEVELTGGVNQILIDAISDNGEENQRQLNVIYSSEFAKEISK